MRLGPPASAAFATAPLIVALENLEAGRQELAGLGKVALPDSQALAHEAEDGGGLSRARHHRQSPGIRSMWVR